MAKISFTKSFEPIEVASGENLMQALLNASIPVASSCYGDGVCGKCRMEVLSGAENLSKPTPLEDMIKERLGMDKALRISCQTRVEGDVTVDTSYW